MIDLEFYSIAAVMDEAARREPAIKRWPKESRRIANVAASVWTDDLADLPEQEALKQWTRRTRSAYKCSPLTFLLIVWVLESIVFWVCFSLWRRWHSQR